MKQFNWQLASVLSIAEKIKESGKENMRGQILHYKKSGNTLMLERILLAKKIVEMWECEEMVNMLKKEIISAGVTL